MADDGESPRLRYSNSFFLPLILLGGFALAGIVFLFIMQSIGWKSERLSGPEKMFATIHLSPSDVYLLNSKYTRNYFTSVGGNYELVLNQWRYFFRAKGIDYVDIQDADLDRGLKPGVLILPSAVALSQEERQAVAAFENAGGSVLATWATGARDEAGQWVGWDFLKEQFGVTVTGEIAKMDKENFLMPFGDTPVSHTLPSGNRIWLDRYNERPLRFTGGAHVAGRFMDVVRTPDPNPANEAIVYDETGSSRKVYFGFSETSWRFQQDDMYALLEDTLRWLHRKPTAYLADWPYPYRSAQILEMDTEQGFPNALNFAKQLEANRFSGTFYCLSSVATQYPDAVKELGRENELAYHGDVHDSFKGQSGEVQGQRLDRMVQEMKTVIPDVSGLTGFRPPYELYDDTTESVLHEKGFRHLLVDSNNTKGRIPYLTQAGSQDIRTGLVIFPRTQRDDINLLRAGLSAGEMAKTMDLDFDLALEMGALGVFSVHSQNFAPESPVAQAMAEYLAHVKAASGRVWVEPSGKIESWWRERGRISFDLSGDPKRMLLNVTISKPGIGQKAVIVLTNREKGIAPQVTAAKAGVPMPDVQTLDEFRTALVFSGTPPGDYGYYLGF